MELAALLLSLKVAFWAVLCSLPFGVMLAWVLARLNFPGKSLLDGLLHLPLVLPPVVIGYLLLVALGRNGVIGKILYEYIGVSIAFTWKGAVVASAAMAFPLLVRAVRLSLDAVDKRLEMAARTLGAGPWRVFFTITLPLSMPGVVAGMVLAFARSLGEFGATITFVSNIPGQTQTLPLALYTMTQVPNGEAAAMRLCLIAIVIALFALIGANWLEKYFARRFEG
jgi:molybdate transport system permease protein